MLEMELLNKQEDIPLLLLYWDSTYYYCVNKMDLVDYDQKQYEKIKEELVGFSAKLRTKDFRFIPISALNGDNVVNRSNNMPGMKEVLITHTGKCTHCI